MSPSDRVVSPAAGASSRPELVVTLPGRTPEELKAQLAVAQAGGADLVEIRLDRMRREDLPRLESLHQIPILHEWVPAIATVRSKVEGGEGPDDLPTRRAIFEEAFRSLPFTWVDLEVARDLPLRSDLPSAFGRRLGIIASAHVPGSTDLKALERILQSVLKSGDVGKVVLPSAMGRAVRELVPLCERWRGVPYVLHTTGPSSPLLRVLSGRLGMVMVYCGLPEARSRVEAGQPPVDRMRATLDGTGRYPWYGILGRPVGHTLSPFLHNGFLDALGLPGVYVPLEMADGSEFQALVPGLFGWGAKGFNVTRPFKPDAYAIATERDVSVTSSGVANTLVPTGPHGIRARNTDLLALERVLLELKDQHLWRELRLLVVGSGGLARAAVAAGIEVGARVELVARSPQAAADLVAAFSAGTVTCLPVDRLAPAPLVIHATPAGQDGVTKLEVALEDALGPGSLLLDGVYLPRSDELERLAKARGARYVDGWRLLVYQAAFSFQEFTGTAIPWNTVEQIAAKRPAMAGDASTSGP